MNIFFALKNLEKKILIADEDKAYLDLESNILTPFYNVFKADSAEKALKYLEKNVPDMILIGKVLSDSDGLELLKRLKNSEKLSEIQVIFISESKADEKKSFDLGAMDFISKPFEESVFLSRIKRVFELCGYREYYTEELKLKNNAILNMQQEFILSVAQLIESRDGTTGEHILRTRDYAEALANAMRERGLYEDILTDSYIKNLRLAASMHDIGKLAIPDRILKNVGSLTKEEFEVMKKHSELGAEIVLKIMDKIEEVDLIQLSYEVTKYHHERWDGSGYPEGLKETQIPLSARIVALADVFDALTSKRDYKKPLSLDEVFSVISIGRGQHFEPAITDIFIEIYWNEIKKLYLKCNMEASLQL